MNYKSTIISAGLIAILGLAAGTTLFLSYHSQSVNVVTSSSQPDAFMDDVVAIMMDQQGKPKMKIVTPKMVHYEENDTTDLTTPQLTLYRKSPEPWYVSSKYARATQGSEQVKFWENVVIHHSADGENPATLIKTETLIVHPNQQIADTNDAITMVQPNLTVKAVGMHADMNSGDIKLLSQARGEYVPSS